MTTLPGPVAKVQCPHCQTRLHIYDTASGGRTVRVSMLGPTVESSAQALELFRGPDAGPQLVCPACAQAFDPSRPYRLIPLPRRIVGAR